MADVPLDELLVRAEDLAKGWLLALLEEAPLDDAPGILAADLAIEGPRMCEAVLRAIADDTDLRRLEPGGALERLVARVGELAGATSLEATLRAVDALQAVLWSALRNELRAPDPDQISEIAERLALVIEFVRGATLRRQLEGAPAGPRGADLPRVPAQAGSRFEASPFGPAARAPAGPAAQAPAEAPAALHPPTPPPYPHAPPPAPPTAEAPGEAAGEPPGEAAPKPPGEAAPKPPGELAPEPPGEAAPAPPTAAADRPGEAEPETVSEALWVGAFAEEIQRAERSGSPLALLLAELEDANRVAEVEEPAQVTVTFGRFAQAVRTVARRQDILVCETPTRAWIIARDTGRLGAQALGSRIAAAVREGPSWRGAPMIASVGVSVLGEDGRAAGELIEAAEVSRFGAAASGIGIIRAMPREAAFEPPAGPGPWLVG